MNKYLLRVFTSTTFTLALAVSILLVAAGSASAQCSTLVAGLRQPLGTALTNQGNLLVSETGTVALHSGRISIIDASGNRRTLLDGLPSALNDLPVPEPSGPAGLFMRGRSLYVVIGVGDVARPGLVPGTIVPNPAGPSSPLFSSVLKIHFSAKTEKTTEGFTLSVADQQALADGETVNLSDAEGNRVQLDLVANFPDFIPLAPPTIRHSNPFQLVAIEDDLYVTDGGRNLLWQVDLTTGWFSQLVTFPAIPNPLFGIVPAGGPFLDAVPTGITAHADQLLVTLFRGVPFPANTSTVQQVDPLTATNTAFITGLKTAMDILAVTDDDDTDYLVLQHSSGLGPFFGGPGVVLHFESPAGPPTVLASCLVRPTTMTLDRKAATLYVSEFGGRVVAIPVP